LPEKLATSGVIKTVMVSIVDPGSIEFSLLSSISVYA
jgi:hypothetical protein